MKMNSPSLIKPTLTITLLFLLTAQPAAAAGFADFLNNILDEFNAVKNPLAVIAIMLTGICFLFNLIDLRRVGYVIIGIIVLFGATEIVSMVTG